ncbi:MAG: permease [Planctomycetes bacterium]|nr:permease [Planctomycetota bacterium]
MKIRKKHIKYIFIAVYVIFILISLLFSFDSGNQIGANSANFVLELLKILPCAFILIGLFEVWVKKEKVEKYFGEKSGFMGYIWSIILAGSTVGGLYVAFPVAYSLRNKGAKLSIVFTYVGAAGICRIPMTIFEASFMGLKFTLIKLIVSLPLVILSSILLGKYLEKHDYQLLKGK